MYLLFAFACINIARHIPPQIPFSTISSTSTSVNNSNSTSVFFKHSCHANPGAHKKCAGSNSYTLIHMLLKFSNASASNNVSL